VAPRAQREDAWNRKRNRRALSALGFKLWLERSDYRTIQSQSKVLLTRIIRAVRYQSDSDYWSDSGHSQLMDFATENNRAISEHRTCTQVNRHQNPHSSAKTRTTNQNPPAPPAKSVTYMSGQIRAPRSRTCPVKSTTSCPASVLTNPGHTSTHTTGPTGERISDGLASGHTGRHVRSRISFRAVPTGLPENG
jgi:hypothetical protein